MKLSEKRKVRVSVYGNPLVKEDSLPLRILPKLKTKFPGIEFLREDPSESIIHDENEWWILDSAKGVREVTVIDDLDKLDTFKQVSVHDYDLALDLKILQKLGKVGKVKIIALPEKLDEESAIAKVAQILTASLSSKSG